MTPVEPKVIKLGAIRQWGLIRLFPVNDAAREICLLTGRKTFSDEDIEHAKRLGFAVEII